MHGRIMYCSLVLLCFIGNIVQGQINHQVRFSSGIQLKKNKLDDNETYIHVAMDELQQRTDSVGFPSLPVKYINLLVPENAEVSGIHIKNVSKQKQKLAFKIEPFQPPMPTSLNYKNPGFVKPDKARYNSRTPYPLNLVDIVEHGYFRGNQIVTLAIYPCRYYPKADELEIIESIDFTLLYKEKVSKIKKLTKTKDNSLDRKILEGIVVNKADIERFAPLSLNENTESSSVSLKNGVSTIESSVESGITVNCDYVVVTSASLAPAFNEFMAWKRRKGIKTELVTIEDIKANYTGDNISGINDDAGKLRQFLSDAFDNGSTYALLAGDNTVVPIRYGWSSNNTTNSNYIIPTDLYFSDFDGDWEVDGDGRYGEPSNDNVDYNPEIYVGRLLCSTEQEVKNWVKKTLIYELNPGNGNYTYLKKALYTQADHLQQGDQARYIATRFNTVFNDYEVFEEKVNGVPNPNSDNIVPNFPTGQQYVAECNNNYGLLGWFCHGSPRSIGLATDSLNDWHDDYAYVLYTKDEYDVTLPTGGIQENSNGLDNLTNKNYPSLLYSISCDVTPFDDFNHDASIKNLGEGFTVITESGGPAFLGNTRYGYVDYSYLLFENFINTIVNSTLFKLGIAEATSKQNYNGVLNHYLRFTHNLIGCPETEMWTAIPSKFTSATVSESGSNVTVSTGGVSNSTICVMSALDNGGSYYVVRENVSSSTFTSVPKPYLVTITKHNYIPYLKNPDNIHFQNEYLYLEKYIYAGNIYAGQNVTTSKPTGLVKVKNGSNVVFDATNDVLLEAGFEVELGGEFEAK